MTRPSVYRLAKKRGWETKLVAMPGGGNRKLYDVSESEFTPSEIEHSNEKDAPLQFSSSDIPDLRPKMFIPLDLHEQADLRARLCELITELFRLEGKHGGRKPFEVFHEAVIPVEQQIDLTQLNFLMLAAANPVVQASGDSRRTFRNHPRRYCSRSTKLSVNLHPIVSEWLKK